MQSKNSPANVLFVLLQAAIEGTQRDLKERVNPMSMAEDWPAVYRMAQEQGVLAMAWDGVQRLVEAGELTAEQLPERKFKLQWAFNVEQIEKRYRMQEQRAVEFAQGLAHAGLDLHVLKGLAISGYYPHPEHRECGDLDCFLRLRGEVEADHPEGAYEAGNRAAEALAAKVKRGYYKHSHIVYRGLQIENHQFCTAIRGRKERKAFERHLQGLLTKGEPHYINSSKLIRPSADFNALFLTVHGFQHFLSEGIKLRHILDWALLLKAEQEKINWAEFYAWCDKMHFTRFVNALTAIAVRDFGVQITCPEIRTESPYRERILEDTLYNSEGVFNKGYSPWRSRLQQVCNKFSFSWKYHKIYQRSLLGELLRAVVGFVCERQPKL